MASISTSRGIRRVKAEPTNGPGHLGHFPCSSRLGYTYAVGTGTLAGLHGDTAVPQAGAALLRAGGEGER